METNIKRGDIYYADLSPVVGSEQGGLRPVLIVQNDIGNRYSPTVIAAAITSKMGKAQLPTHIDIYASEVGLAKDSVILLEQIYRAFKIINNEQYLFDSKGKGLTKTIKLGNTKYYYTKGKMTKTSDKSAGRVAIGFCGASKNGQNLLYAYHYGDCSNVS